MENYTRKFLKLFSLVLIQTNSYSQPVFMNSATSMGTGAPAVVNTPSGVQNGDLLVIGFMFEKGSDEVITPPLGWSLILRTNNTSNGGMATYYKIAENEPSSYSFGLDNSSKWSIGISRISDFDITSPIENFAALTGDSGNPQAPSINTLGSNRLVLCFYTNKRNAYYTAASQTTERYDAPNSNESLPSNMMADFVMAAEGNTGNKMANVDFTERWVAQQISVKPSGALPIELLNFEVNLCAKNSSVCLSWITASEINNDFFTVERSEDSHSFEPIARIKGAGNSSSIRHYNQQDTTSFQIRKTSILYYRIRQTDFDGTSEVSKTIAVRFTERSNSFAVFPNPATGNNIFLRGKIPCHGPIKIVIRDLSGREHFTKICSCKKDFFETIEIEKLLSKGIYFISAESGADSFMQRLVIE